MKNNNNYFIADDRVLEKMIEISTKTAMEELEKNSEIEYKIKDNRKMTVKLLENYVLLKAFIEKSEPSKMLIADTKIHAKMHVLIENLKIDIDLSEFFFKRMDMTLDMLQSHNTNYYNILTDFYIKKKDIKEMSHQYHFSTRTILNYREKGIDFMNHLIYGTLIYELVNDFFVFAMRK